MSKMSKTSVLVLSCLASLYMGGGAFIAYENQKNRTVDFVVADVNGDGHPDVVEINKNDKSVRNVFLGLRDGSHVSVDRLQRDYEHWTGRSLDEERGRFNADVARIVAELYPGRASLSSDPVIIQNPFVYQLSPMNPK